MGEHWNTSFPRGPVKYSFCSSAVFEASSTYSVRSSTKGTFTTLNNPVSLLRYVKAVSSKADVEAIQEEGKAYNKKVLELFKYVQDNFIGIVFSSDVVMKHVGYQNNIEYMDEVIDDLNDNKISDALDVAYQLNGLCEYNYYLFSPNAAAKIDAHADKAVDNNRWWGNDKGFYFTNTKEATASLLKREDGDDVSEEIKVYEDARAQQLNYYKDSLEKEIQAMEKIGK